MEGVAWHCHEGCRGMKGQADSSDPVAACLAAAHACSDSSVPSAAAAAREMAPTHTNSLSICQQARLKYL